MRSPRRPRAPALFDGALGASIGAAGWIVALTADSSPTAMLLALVFVVVYVRLAQQQEVDHAHTT